MDSQEVLSALANLDYVLQTESADAETDGDARVPDHAETDAEVEERPADEDEAATPYGDGMLDEMERFMVHTAYSTIGLRVERLERAPGVRTVLCLDEATGGLLYKAPESMSNLDAARHAVPLVEMCRRFRSTAATLRRELDDSGPFLLSIRSRKKEYVLSQADSSSLAVVVVQNLRVGDEEDAAGVTSVALRQLELWGRARLEDDPSVGWLFGAADE